MKTKAINLFTASAGALLLATATALFLINGTAPAGLVTPHDPLFGLNGRPLFWIAGGLALALALVCLFAHRPAYPLCLLAWLATNGLVYLLGTYWSGWHGLTGLLGGFNYTFGIPITVANALLEVALGGLLIGSYGSLLWLWRLEKAEANYLKLSCPECGVHLKFPMGDAGRKISCPHCSASVTLRKPANLKMSCFFCQEHIEFPAHALGQKIKCPHCDHDITLKEPA